MDFSRRASTSEKIFVSAAAVAFTLCLGVLDHVTGDEISSAFFYLLPVSAVAWFVGANAGIVFSLLSAGIWEAANWPEVAGRAQLAIAVWNGGSRLGFFIVVTLLLSRLRLDMARQESLARTDALTGLLNRRAIEERGALETARARRHGSPLAVAYLDLDDFKTVNDRHGHAEGDAVLRTVARTLLAGVREVDAVARLGGDEFCILFPDTEQAEARETVDRLHASLTDALAARDWPVTASWGVAVAEGSRPRFSALLRTADSLMYEAKSAGRNVIRYENPPEGAD